MGRNEEICLPENAGGPDELSPGVGSRTGGQSGGQRGAQSSHCLQEGLWARKAPGAKLLHLRHVSEDRKAGISEASAEFMP